MVFLGQASNYSAGRVLRHLLAMGTSRHSLRLRQTLAQTYHAQLENVALYQSGRSALAVAFRHLLPTGGTVILPGLTCIALVRAVKAAGCEAEFVDITREDLQYNYQKLAATCQKISEQATTSQKTIDKNNKVCYNGIIVAQNTLGLPLDMRKLQKIANQYHFAIVEDLAHSAGRFYPDGRAIGSVGQATALSFGKGKAIDTIEGGAVILRLDDVDTDADAAEASNAKDVKTSASVGAESASILIQPTQKPRAPRRWRDRWYPVFGSIARGLAHFNLDRYWLGLLLKLHWIERSADAVLDVNTRLTHWQAKLALDQLSRLPRTPLREFRLVERRADALQELRRAGYRLEEIWYDTPVSPARYATEAAFPARACPETVQIAAQIVNLPTWYPEQKLARARAILQKYEVQHG